MGLSCNFSLKPINCWTQFTEIDFSSFVTWYNCWNGYMIGRYTVKVLMRSKMYFHISSRLPLQKGRFFFQSREVDHNLKHLGASLASWKLWGGFFHRAVAPCCARAQSGRRKKSKSKTAWKSQSVGRNAVEWWGPLGIQWWNGGSYFFRSVWVFIFPVKWGAVRSYLEFPNHLIVKGIVFFRILANRKMG